MMNLLGCNGGWCLLWRGCSCRKKSLITNILLSENAGGANPIGRITEVAKQLQAEIHSTVSSKYTDVAMSTVVVFDGSLGDHVAQLDASSITIGSGKVFYLCLPNMV